MKLKNKLEMNTLSIGSWVTIGHQSIIEIMATAGFDWLVIDMEHSAITLDKAQGLITAIQSKNMAALVRVGSNDELIIKQIMDAGADGVVVPMINSKDDAIKAVKSVHYPPEGNRGVGLARAQNYGIGFDKYKEWLKRDSIIIAQIEHKDAVENISEIISVKGIDGVIIGPYDMSASFGIPGELDNPILLNAIKRVENVCKGSNFTLGYHIIKPNHTEVQEKVELGYSFIGFSLDFFFLGEKARDEMKELING
jgi:2-keto-3-deoxy-L-rhamnonate aldolase RhmA